MLKKLFLSTIAGLSMAGAASALSFGAADLNLDLPTNFNPFGTAPAAFTALTTTHGGGTTNGVLSYRSDGAAANPLSVTGVSLKFTYIGSEAGFTNKALAFGGTTVFTNTTASIGDTITLGPVSAGLLDFAYCTDRGTASLADDGCINNDATKSSGNSGALEIAASKIFTFNGKKTVIMFFGDDTDDGDLDDMVVAIQAVPLPAGMLLMGTALAGLGAVGVRRRRKS